MAAGFDHSIILQAMRQGPSAFDTMEQLQGMQQQRQQHETTLASLLQKQNQERALADVFRQHAGSVSDPVASALMGAGLGKEAMGWMGEQSEIGRRKASEQGEIAKMLRGYQEQVSNLLYGTKDQADYEARLSTVPPQQRAMFPPSWDEARPLVDAIAIPAEKRAQLDATATEAQKRRTFEADERARDRANRTKNAGIMAGQRSDGAGRKEVTDLRKEITSRPEIAKYRKASAELSSLKELAKESSGASDMALVFAFMKAMDPESVVRESEYASAAATGKPDERMMGLVSKWWTGGPLSRGQRQAFIKAAQAAQSGHKSAYERATKTYKRVAAKHDYDLTELGLDDEDTAGPLGDDERAELEALRKELGQ